MSINRRMAKGASWMVGLRFFNRGVGFIGTLILARLLVPEDFGLVAMATVFFAFLVSISNFSVHILLVQKTEIDTADMDSAWSLQVVVGAVQSLVLLLLAAPVAKFYQEPRLVEIMLVLALIALLKGCKNIGVVMFQRNMDFSKDFLLMAAQKLVMFGVTLSAALILRTYWALILGMLSGAVVECGLSYVMHPHRPRWCRSRWREIIRFSRWILINNVLNFIANRGPDLILGRLIGARAVGLFSVGYEVAMLPSTELVAPINRAILPGYSRLRETEGGLQKGYLDVIGMITLLVLPAGIGIAATVDILVPLLLGDKWLATVPIIYYLAIAGAIGSSFANGGSVFLALGKPHITTIIHSIRISILVPGVFLGTNYGGVGGVAVAYLGVIAIMTVITLTLVLRLLKLPVWRYLGTVYRPVLAAGTMYSVITLLIHPYIGDYPLWLSALICIGGGVLVYISVVLGLWMVAGSAMGAESRILTLAAEIMEKRLPALSGSLRRLSKRHL